MWLCLLFCFAYIGSSKDNFKRLTSNENNVFHYTSIHQVSTKRVLMTKNAENRKCRKQPPSFILWCEFMSFFLARKKNFPWTRVFILTKRHKWVFYLSFLSVLAEMKVRGLSSCMGHKMASCTLPIANEGPVRHYRDGFINPWNKV